MCALTRLMSSWNGYLDNLHCLWFSLGSTTSIRTRLTALPCHNLGREGGRERERLVQHWARYVHIKALLPSSHCIIHNSSKMPSNWNTETFPKQTLLRSLGSLSLPLIQSTASQNALVCCAHCPKCFTLACAKFTPSPSCSVAANSPIYC